jgi:hypothetical protein
MMRRTLAAGLLTLFLAVAASAQGNPLAPSARYNPAIPTVKSVLGYAVGENFTFYHDLVGYYEQVAAASDRVRLEPYGRSGEGRTLYLLIVTSPGNQAQLDEIRQAIARLSDPRQTSPAEAQALLEKTPVIVWLSYNVHGNEAVSSEAALQVVYELAASEDERVRNWLENAVVVIDPVVNPDGRERYVRFYRSTVGAHPNPDRFAAEHQEPWPGGRTNHYFFDLNRDWAWQTQPESQARVHAYREWNPQVHIDYHEMGADSTYFFFPPRKPVLETIAPLLGKWFDIYARGNAAAFDRYAFRYYTREDFDLFYPSYGDSWPSLHGAIGMTYEQAGGGRAGLVVDLPDVNRRLTLRDRTARHFVSSLATINTSVENRAARLQDYYDFRRAALDAGAKGPAQRFYLPPAADAQRLAAVIATLLRDGIEVQQAQAEFDADGLRSSWGEDVGRERLPAGTYIVDLAQPNGFLARALLEREASRQIDFFFDVSGWSLPLAAGIEAYASDKPVRVAVSSVTEPPALAGGVEGPAQASAYVFSWDSSAAVRLLGQLLQQDINAYVSLKPFKISGRDFPAGSIVVPAETNAATAGERLRALAGQDGVSVFAVSTQLSEQGFDLGSPHLRFLRRPRVGILTDVPVSSGDYGALWYWFDKRMGLPFTALRVERLRGVDLSQYDVLILPDDSGNGRGYSRYLDNGLIDNLKEWVERGGVLIGLGGGAVFATEDKVGLATVGHRFVRREEEEARLAAEKPAGEAEKKPAEKLPALSLEEKLRPYAEREQAEQKEEIPGSILRTELDTTHPLGFGLNKKLAVLDLTSPILELTSAGENVAYFPDTDLKLSGFLTEENQQKLAHTAYLLREPHGKGQVILFAENPVFRGFWLGTARLLENAVFFGDVTQP